VTDPAVPRSRFDPLRPAPRKALVTLAVLGAILWTAFITFIAIVLMLGPIYPLAYWLIAACAALVSEIPALFRGPRGDRLTWDIDRDWLGP